MKHFALLAIRAPYNKSKMSSAPRPFKKVLSQQSTQLAGLLRVAKSRWTGLPLELKEIVVAPFR